MISPTGDKIRTWDQHGSGAYAASRGSDRKRKTHRGVDFIGEPGQHVVCPIDKAQVVRIARPYMGNEYSGLLLTSRDIAIKMFYFEPIPEVIEHTLLQGALVGYMQDISNRYPGITPHVHLEIVGINPEIFLRMP